MSPKTKGEVDESHSSRFYWIMRLTDNEKGNMSRLYINTKMHENIIFVTIYKCDWSLSFWQEIWLDLIQKTYFSLFFFFFSLQFYYWRRKKEVWLALLHARTDQAWPSAPRSHFFPPQGNCTAHLSGRSTDNQPSLLPTMNDSIFSMCTFNTSL